MEYALFYFLLMEIIKLFFFLFVITTQVKWMYLIWNRDEFLNGIFFWKFLYAYSEHQKKLNIKKNIPFFISLKSPWSSRWCVGLLDVKSRFEPQARHQLPWKVSQNICRSASSLNCRSRHLCIRLTHTT